MLKIIQHNDTVKLRRKISRYEADSDTVTVNTAVVYFFNKLFLFSMEASFVITQRSTESPSPRRLLPLLQILYLIFKQQTQVF